MTVTALQKPATPGEATASVGETKGGGKKKLVVIVLVLLLAAGAAYWFVLKPKGGPAPAPTPGTVLPLDAIQINLAAEHYLRLGIALQLQAGVKEADGSKALDAAIDEFSGRPIEQVTNPARRRALKTQLEKELEKRYPDEVMGVYFTEFVTQ